MIIFLNGIARGRHQWQVRKIPWTTFFNGVVHTTNKQTVAPPTEGQYPTTASFSTHKWRDGAAIGFLKCRVPCEVAYFRHVTCIIPPCRAAAARSLETPRFVSFQTHVSSAPASSN